MFPAEMLVLVAVIGAVGGVVAGIGGPGGIPVLLALNLLLALSPSVAAATASSVFIVATMTATGLYYHSDGIDWALAATVGLPALVGTHAGTTIATTLPPRRFEFVLGGVLLLAALGIFYQQRGDDEDGPSLATTWNSATLRGVVALGSLLVGVLAGITGIGGPALTVPFMIFLGVNSIVAIGAGLASGVLITANTTLGHALQGTGPALVPLAVVGVPYVTAQVLGWKYVHSVSERTVAYTVAAIAGLGGLVVVA